MPFHLIAVILSIIHEIASQHLKKTILETHGKTYTEDVSCTITPTPAPIINDLVISSDSDCNKIEENTWKSITVNAGLCNSMNGDLVISGYPYLESITIMADNQSNTLANLHSLMIIGNPKLQSIVLGDGNKPNSIYGACVKINSVSLISMITFQFDI